MPNTEQNKYIIWGLGVGLMLLGAVTTYNFQDHEAIAAEAKAAIKEEKQDRKDSDKEQFLILDKRMTRFEDRLIKHLDKISQKLDKK